VLRSALEAAVTGDAALVERVYSEDVEGWSPAFTIHSRAALVDEVRGRRGAFSDIALGLQVVGETGDGIVGEWRFAATHSGRLELDDDYWLEATGRRIQLRGVTIAEFDGDRITRFRQYWDEVALLEGLGLLPPGGAHAPRLDQGQRDAARRLAQETRAFLVAETYSNRRIDELAAKFVATHPDADENVFISWALAEGSLG
jgi:ketosteroid isomerase-like protein